ncbi:ABC transporter permease [Galbitalea sp. SE-J8]|uniref:ABC transporter permease n=1 Tax=Galbitalea sp. SE-J8 TaxID=3054952 RepID=UPI00259C9E21|nr:ABC transporter permease [Galbitalea sp. SE-J8]MDM4764067.1 ABC transporter permease [Galbitalea sp. SE-J8]
MSAIAPSRRGSRRALGMTVTVLAPVLLFAVLGLVWEWVATHNPSLIPPLEKIAKEFVSRPDFYLSQVWTTLASALIGLVIGVLVALVIAAAIVHVRFLAAAVMPVALIINVTPIVAIAPALIVAFGFTRLPHITVAALSVFFPMLINATAGLRSIDSQALDVFRSMSASRWNVFVGLRLPTSLPFLFAGLRQATSAAMIGAIIAEFTGTNAGLGATITNATFFLNLAQMWTAIALSALVSIILMGIVALVERLVLRW